ncbi:MAG: hypothetical protein R3F61_12190 [Myxococcota bacterium]
MSSPFLVAFVEAVVGRLLDRGDLEIADGETDAVVHAVAARLGTAGQGESLVSTLSKALLACEAVEELYADDMDLKELITDLPTDVLPRGGLP